MCWAVGITPSPTGSALQLQAYYDHQLQSEPGVGEDDLHTYDLYLQHSFSWGARQSIVWGGEYRIQHDDFPVDHLGRLSPVLPAAGPEADPWKRLRAGHPRADASLKLTLGTKLEDEPYTGSRYCRAGACHGSCRTTTCCGRPISRAVRAPSRLDRDLYENAGAVPCSPVATSSRRSWRRTRWAIGRSPPREARSRSRRSTTCTTICARRSFPPAVNCRWYSPIAWQAETYGVEIWGSYQLLSWWRLDAGRQLAAQECCASSPAARRRGSPLHSPATTPVTRSRCAHRCCSRATECSTCLRARLARCPSCLALPTPRWTQRGWRGAWFPSLELSLKGSNLIHPQHLEFGTTVAPLQLGSTGGTGRAWYLEVRWRPSALQAPRPCRQGHLHGTGLVRSARVNLVDFAAYTVARR